ncbi:uncharacterized protein [Cicer arietinum]|uniref:Uncharacterized protein LOC101508811 n=1 Tax=Cicer arietinum TaxID=3827 RepID=A0A3Q7YGY2_CICAR|nr:uncharacterized protein LOC101508811 [Cicer arietinum]
MKKGPLGKDKRTQIGERQTGINDVCDKEARARTIPYIALFFYTNEIAFNVARSKSFKLMLEAVGNYGLHLKPPSYHELRVPLLEKELEYTKALLNGHQLHRAKYGCSIMSDGWTDRKNRTLINFLVNSTAGTMFVKSIDAYAYMKTVIKIFELLDNFVEEIGEQNIVQVVTDNGSNYVLAGKLLTAKRPHLFWTPCAAHCLYLMLEDIGKIAKVKMVIQKGISLVGFIYNHTLALNIMRKNTGNVELVRHGVTRFATTFLTLQRLHKQKTNLRTQLSEYKIANGLFGLGGAIRQRTTLAPAEWWKTYGAQTPLLQLLAIKVLSLTCSSSGCERNWSTFEHIHSKKRSRLEHKRLEDLVFVKYNQALKERYDCRDVIDPIVLNDDNDYINEFEVGDLGDDGEPVEELVYAGDNLTWTDVANASGANEPVVYTRRAAKEKATASASRAIAQETISKEVVVEEYVEEVEPIYVEDDEEEENEEYIEVDGEDEEEEEEEDYVEDDDDF